MGLFDNAAEEDTERTVDLYEQTRYEVGCPGEDCEGSVPIGREIETGGYSETAGAGAQADVSGQSGGVNAQNTQASGGIRIGEKIEGNCDVCGRTPTQVHKQKMQELRNESEAETKAATDAEASNEPVAENEATAEGEANTDVELDTT